MLIHSCRRCRFKSKVYMEWIDHLWKKDHQKLSKSSFLKWTDEENLRSLVVYVATSPFPLPSQIISLLLEQSVCVVDFVCWQDRPQNFVVQLISTEHVEKVLKTMRENPMELSFCKRPLGLRRKSDIADFEWPCLIGDGITRNGSSENPVLIELSDDCNSNDSGDANSNGIVNTADPIGNGRRNSAHRMETDDTSNAPIQNGHNGVVDNENDGMSEDEELEDVHIETRMSEQFQEQFLAVKCKQTKDDKSKVLKNLQLVQSQWLEVYVGFHNLIWPLCFVMKNRAIKTNKNEVGFEAKFKCECIPSQFNKWVGKNYKKDLVDAKIKEFAKLIADDQELAKRISEIEQSTDYGKAPNIKFRCHFIVTFTVSGSATAKMKWKNISGKKVERRVKTFHRVFKNLFLTYEAMKIREWSQDPKGEKRNLKKEKVGTNGEWTELEVITVE